METRETLLQRLSKTQDENSWEEFVGIYQQYIYNICRRMGLNHHDAEEIVQKVLLRLWKKLAEFIYDKKKTFRGLVCTVTGGLVKDFFAQVGRRNNREDKAANHQQWLNKETSDHDIENIAEDEWKSYVANLALKNISPKFSPKVLEIFKGLMTGKSTAVLAEEFQVETNTVNVYKKRVMIKLHEEIRHLNEELQ